VVLGKMAILTFAMFVLAQVIPLLDSWWTKIGKYFVILSYLIFYLLYYTYTFALDVLRARKKINPNATIGMSEMKAP
jgi:hypothetical protein